jgi:hypothetical protein
VLLGGLTALRDARQIAEHTEQLLNVVIEQRIALDSRSRRLTIPILRTCSLKRPRLRPTCQACLLQLMPRCYRSHEEAAQAGVCPGSVAPLLAGHGDPGATSKRTPLLP